MFFTTRSYEESEATCAKFAQVRDEGGRQVRREVEHYSLDVILAVGYRVSSRRATEFRRWATKTLKAYLKDGYALNERRLRGDPDALKGLAARVRALRSDEKQVYAAVRECFKISAVDYDKDAPEARTFYATLQDKFLYAMSNKTASEIILDRADGDRLNMGVTCMKRSVPTLDEAKVGKNYLNNQELYTLHLLCEQFLLYTESKAIRRHKLTMGQLLTKLDELLVTNEYPVFTGYRGDFLRDRAHRHAAEDSAQYRERVRRGEVVPVPPSAVPRRLPGYRRESARL